MKKLEGTKKLIITEIVAIVLLGIDLYLFRTYGPKSGVIMAVAFLGSGACIGLAIGSIVSWFAVNDYLGNFND